MDESTDDVNAGDVIPRKPRGLLNKVKNLRSRGRSAAREGLDVSGQFFTHAASQTSSIARKTLRKTGDLSETSIEIAASGFDSVSDKARDAASAVLSLARDSTEALKDRIFRETTVPVILLPTGSCHSDFFVTYSFESALETLQSGVFVRPVLEVWAARPDIDRSHLATVLRDSFLKDFKTQKEAARSRHGLANIKTVVAAREAKGRQEEVGKEIQSAAGWVGAGLVGMFFTWNPLFDLLFLTLAVYKGAAGLRKTLEYLGHATREASIEAELAKSRKQLSKLEADLDSKNETFRTAVANLEIRVHPQLQDLLIDFASVDSQTYIPVQPSPDGPDVSGALQLINYKRFLPDWGRTILEAHLPNTSSRA